MAEVHNMAGIFKNAYLTIIAASGQSAAAGLQLGSPSKVPSQPSLKGFLNERTPWSQRVQPPRSLQSRGRLAGFHGCDLGFETVIRIRDLGDPREMV